MADRSASAPVPALDPVSAAHDGIAAGSLESLEEILSCPPKRAARVAGRPAPDPRRCTGPRAGVRRVRARLRLRFDSRLGERLGGDPPVRRHAAALDRRREALQALRPRRGAHRPLDGRRPRRRLPARHDRRLALLRGQRRSTGLADPSLPKLVTFWALAILLVTLARAMRARTIARRSPAYVQNTSSSAPATSASSSPASSLQHPEYGISLVGFVDADPRPMRPTSRGSPVLGPPSDLPGARVDTDIERVVVAFSRELQGRDARARSGRFARIDVQIDIVPRLFDAGRTARASSTRSRACRWSGLPPTRSCSRSRARSSARSTSSAPSIGLLLTSPALRLHRACGSSATRPARCFFRQTRLGMDMREFTTLKFRTMRVDTDDAAHREYIQQTMSADAAAGSERPLQARPATMRVTPFGRWLRKTSLDELPQLINVLRGDMSLVGPRPCIPYEIEYFEPHHFERFLVPQGLTGLWQVTARAHVDLRRGARHGRRLRARLVARPRPRAPLRTPFALLRDSSGTRLHDRVAGLSVAVVGSATGARTSSATSTSSRSAEVVVGLRPARRTRSRRSAAATRRCATTTRLRRRPRRPDASTPSRSRRPVSTHFALARRRSRPASTCSSRSRSRPRRPRRSSCMRARRASAASS